MFLTSSATESTWEGVGRFRYVVYKRGIIGGGVLVAVMIALHDIASYMISSVNKPTGDSVQGGCC